MRGPRHDSWILSRVYPRNCATAMQGQLAEGFDSLAGLRLFFLSLDLLPESCEAMESV